MTKEDKATPKSKKSKEGGKDGDKMAAPAVPYDVRMQAVTVISKPMASEKQVIGKFRGLESPIFKRRAFPRRPLLFSNAAVSTADAQRRTKNQVDCVCLLYNTVRYKQVQT